MQDPPSPTHRTRFSCALLLALAFLGAMPELSRAQGERAAPELAPAEPAADTSRLAWSGLHRTRYARLLNQFRPGSSGNDQVLELRTTFQVAYDLGRISLVGELQDSRAFLTDENGGVSTAVVNALDLTQAYAQLGAANEAGTSVKLGRFLLELGSGRLVAAEPFRNVARGYTGLLSEAALRSGGRLTVLAGLPVLPMPSDLPSLLKNARAPDEADFDLAFGGVLWRMPAFASELETELYLFVLDEDDDPGERETPDRRLSTAGARIWRESSPGAWDFEIEMMRQLGHRRATADRADVRDLDVDAGFSHVEAGYTFRRRWSPRISLEHEHGSGDANPGDDTWGRFDALFGHRRTDLAPTSIYGALGRENIDTLAVRVSVTPSGRADAFIVYRTLRLAEAADSFAGTGVRDPSGRSGRDAGTLVDARYRRWLRPERVRLDVGATFFINGDFMRTAPNATREGDPTFLYGDVTYTFGSR